MAYVSNAAEVSDFEEQKIDAETRKKISKAILDHVLGMLCRRHGRSILIGEVISSVREKIVCDFPLFYQKKRPARSYIIRQLARPNTNVAMYSNGAEVYVTYSHLVTYMEKYQQIFQPMSGSSRAVAVRKIARDLLEKTQKVDLQEIGRVVRKKEGVSFQPHTILIRSAGFVIKPEREKVFATTKSRVHVFGGK